jgi:hypothetical protein
MTVSFIPASAHPPTDDRTTLDRRPPKDMTLAAPTLAPAAQTPSRVSVAALLRWTFASLLITAGLLAGAMLLANDVAWWRGFIAATLIAVPAAVAGLFPVVLMAARGEAARVPFAFLAGTLLRMMCVVLLLVIAVYLQHAPRVPTALLTLAYYAAMLATEVVVLVGQLRRALPMPPAGTPRAASPAAPTQPVTA